MSPKEIHVGGRNEVYKRKDRQDTQNIKQPAYPLQVLQHQMDRVKRIWYLSPMRAANVQASLRIRAVSLEPPLLAHTSSESRGTFRQKARSLAPLNGWACAVKVCHDGMLEDTNSLDGAQIVVAAPTAKMPKSNKYCLWWHLVMLPKATTPKVKNTASLATTILWCTSTMT